MLKAVIYDMDGVLVDSEPLWRMAMIKAFSEVGLVLSEKECAETTGLRIDKVVDYRYQKSPWEGKSKSQIVTLILDKLIK